MARWGKVDFKQLERLQKKMQRYEKFDSEEFCRMAAKNLAARLLVKVIKRTPVISGDLRRGWTAGEEHVNEKGNVVGIWGKNGFAANMEVEKKGNDYFITVSNGMEYAPYVEYGHRTYDHKGWVKGRFMLTISEQELQSTSPKIIEKLLYEKLKELFDD